MLNILVMRQETLKQKQLIAHKTIQPLVRLVSIKTELSSATPTVASMGRIDHFMRKNSEDNAQNSKSSSLYHTSDIDCEAQKGMIKLQVNIKSLKSSFLERVGSIKSEKLVGKLSISTIEPVQKIRPVIRIETSESDHRHSLYKGDQHINHLMKVNEKLRNLQGKNNAMLLKSIELLRTNEKCYLPSIEAEPDEIRKDDSLMPLETIEPMEASPDKLLEGDQHEGRGCHILRTLKEQAAIRFKEKVKAKQAKKHIYRTLKAKNDTLNRIKLKPHQCTPVSDRADPQVSDQQDLHLMRLHCSEVKQPSCNIRSSNFRSLAKTYYQNIHELRTDTKQSSLQSKPSFELRTTKCQFLTHDLDGIQSPHKRKRGIEAYEQIAMRLRKNIQVSSNNLKANESDPKNVFRELTPWHFEEQ